MQWIVLLLLILGVYFFFIRTRESQPRKPQGKSPASDVMLECERCGTYVSDKEALIVDGRFYCSKECARVR